MNHTGARGIDRPVVHLLSWSVAIQEVREATGRVHDARTGVRALPARSWTMAFYAGRIMHDLAMENPTVVVLTDRNDLDDQLSTTFSRCADLLGLPPVQAEGRADLRAKLAVESGGVVFTTIQKFFPKRRATSIRCCRAGATSS